MLILYNSNEENFNNCGLGILRDAYNVYINRKINSIYELTFNYPTKGFLSEKIQEFMIVKANGQLFRIKSINKKKFPWVITANHIFFDLNSNFLEDVAPTNQNGNGALNWILQRTIYNHKFTGISNIEEINSSRYVRKNVVNAIIGEDNSLIKRWNGEIDVDNFEIKLSDEESVFDVTIDNKENTDIREHIFDMCVENNFKLLMFKTLSLNLEEIFLNITAGEFAEEKGGEN